MPPEIPHREVKAEEERFCTICKKRTQHRYEEISFYAKALFVNLFPYKKRYVRICSTCLHGEEMDYESFNQEVKRIKDLNTPKPTHPKRYEISKRKGIKYCRICGNKIYPDIGYCTACAVRGKGKKK